MTNAQKPSQPLRGATEQHSQGGSSTSRKTIPEVWIERLFEQFSGLYGMKFVDQWRGCDIAAVKRVWSEVLGGYTADEIKRGLDACMTRVFPPTAPEFSMLCRPPLDHERAFHEAVEQMRRREHGEDSWSAPAVYWAAAKLGRDLMVHPYVAIKGRWQSALDEAIAGVRSGLLPGEVPCRREALPAPGKCSISPEEGKRRIAVMREALTAKLVVSKKPVRENTP